MLKFESWVTGIRIEPLCEEGGEGEASRAREMLIFARGGIRTIGTTGDGGGILMIAGAIGTFGSSMPRSILTIFLIGDYFFSLSRFNITFKLF